MTLTRNEVLRLLEENNISPSRALGQNFVADPNTVRRVARLSGIGPGAHVVEVGAGLGSLTLALAETGASVVAVERDRRLVPLLESVLAAKAPGAAVKVVEADAMTLDWATLLAGPEEWSLVANLPYNVATPIVADLLDGVPAIGRMTFMVQREVADRLVAGPGSAAYGAVSVKVSYWAQASLLGGVPSSVFVPKPRVGSALVGIQRRAEPAVSRSVVPSGQFFEVVRTGFAQRRKMLRRALSSLAPPPGAFATAGIKEEARAEELSVEDWGRLAAAVCGLSSRL
ncbi:MAG TPA: 16S rRNA (adenine(1518)-N(6)/adenine(1519)-N(6))-dimethyltransferase RsmA [Acidimicrobiales bacterium]|nr:16S rRNA (adenine(1518)-N(6)/adenine(1519)-N(6))-dimethyltransferase RsmA [Acidimicrobiales bacterium]